MSTLVPITRSDRRLTLAASIGQTVFAFSGKGPLYAPEDLMVFRRVAPATGFTRILSGFTVTLTGTDPAGSTGGQVTFADTPRPTGAPATDIQLVSRRTDERTTDISRSGMISGRAVDEALDRFATILQEVRRDADDLDLANDNLLAALAGVVLGQIPDGSLIDGKFADMPEATAKWRLPGLGPGAPANVTMKQARDGLCLFESVADALGRAVPAVLLWFSVAGFALAGDGGAARYKVVGSEPAHAGKVALAGGKWGEIFEEALDPRMFGAKADGVTNDRTAIVNCIACASALGGAGSGRKISFGHGTYTTDASITIPNNNNGVSQLMFEGSGRYTTFIKAIGAFSGSQIFSIEGVTDISRIGFSGGGKAISAVTNNQAVATDIPTKIHHCEFLSFAGTSGVYRNNDNGIYYFNDNRVSSCYCAIYNYDWGTGARIFNNDILTTSIAIILDNHGHSNEGIIIQNNLIGSVSAHGIQINHGLDIQIINNEITPIQAYGSGYRAVVVTNSAGPVRFINNWIEGFECSVSCSTFTFIGNYFPNGSGITITAPSAGAVSGFEIASNVFAGAGASARVALTNCANFNVHDNQSAGPFYEAGGTLEMIFENNFLTGTSAFSAGSVLRYNRGGSGYTNIISTSATGATINGNGRITGNASFGDAGGTNAVNFLKNLDSQQWMAMRNSSAGTSASIGLLLGNDTSAVLGALTVNGSGRTDLAGAHSINFGSYGATPVGLMWSGVVKFMLRGADGIIDYKQAAVTSGAPFTNTAKVPVYINGVAYNLMLCA